MDTNYIKRIAEIVKESDITELEIESKEAKLKIERGVAGVPALSSVPYMVATAPSAGTGALPSNQGGKTESENEGFIFVKSPMVGTFYRSPSPESPSFVEKGSKVQEDTLVCILEAMKVMNEIHAEVKGTIIDVLVENGEAIEFGQRLFKVKP